MHQTFFLHNVKYKMKNPQMILMIMRTALMMDPQAIIKTQVTKIPILQKVAIQAKI
jgi:hypothetical protein